MRKSVYLETTIVSYLTARPSRDLVLAARQEITRQWWNERRIDFDLFASQFVLDEAGDGDPHAAARRIELLDGIPLLGATDHAVDLAQHLVQQEVLPRKAATDALHIGVATIHGMDILLTWNCTHLANGEILGDVVRQIRLSGYDPPVICTPAELLGE
ncbi:MAG: type II toxin-antitoxin system VapC family toxin [Phycisphaerae bacterium]|nr:type II toxin-antitoxin system VapC family toxin [Phycisphaerae bacterium]